MIISFYTYFGNLTIELVKEAAMRKQLTQDSEDLVCDPAPQFTT